MFLERSQVAKVVAAKNVKWKGGRAYDIYYPKRK